MRSKGWVWIGQGVGSTWIILYGQYMNSWYMEAKRKKIRIEGGMPRATFSELQLEQLM